MIDPDGSSGLDRGVCIELAGGLHAPTRSRAAIATIATPLDRDVRDAVVLMTSELVANSVLHGRAGAQDLIRLDVALRDGCITVRVSDRGPGYAASPNPSPRDAGGWGLVLVDRLASRWGNDDGGRSAWFEIDLRPSDDFIDETPNSAGEREHVA